MSEVYLVARLLNLTLDVAVAAGLVLHWTQFRGRWQRLFGVGLYGYLAASAWATIELMLRGVPGGPRVLLLTPPLVLMAVACYGGTVERTLRRLCERRHVTPHPN